MSSARGATVVRLKFVIRLPTFLCFFARPSAASFFRTCETCQKHSLDWRVKLNVVPFRSVGEIYGGWMTVRVLRLLTSPAPV